MKTLITAFCLLFANTSFATSVQPPKPETRTVTIPKDRSIVINGPIDFGTLDLANKLDRLATGNRQTLYVVLNSPGGIINAGQLFGDAMRIARSRGHKINCVVTMMAASMAFQLLPLCDRRFALSSSMLMFHPARLTVGGRGGASITADQAREIADELDAVEGPSKQDIQDMMGLDADDFKRWYSAERLWTAKELMAVSTKPWLTIVDDIKGLDGNLFVPPVSEQQPGLGGL